MGSAPSQTPPSGRRVRIIFGDGTRPLTGLKRKFFTSVDKIITASLIAKFAPIHTLGPSPNGK